MESKSEMFRVGPKPLYSGPHLAPRAEDSGWDSWNLTSWWLRKVSIILRSQQGQDRLRHGRHLEATLEVLPLSRDHAGADPA